MLSSQEINQYQRHLSLPSFGIAGQEKLKSASVLVIGAGGLGCSVLQYLAAVGVGKIGIVDQDVIEVSNLQRQILYGYVDVGESKSEVAAKKIKGINPHIEVLAYSIHFNSTNAESVLEDYQIVVDGTDNFASRYLINDACVIFNKVLVYGAIYQFEGQVSVFNYKNGPTYRCLFPEPPKSNALPSCSELGVLGVLPGIIGNFQALEVIKLITEMGTVLSGKVLLFDALEQRSRLLSIKRQSESSKIISLKDHSIDCENIMNNNTQGEIVEINPNQFYEMKVKEKDILLLDVREDWERKISKISPSLHIPLGEFNNLDLKDLPDEVNHTVNILIYCKAGVRSRMACESLQKKGFKKLYNLSGGIMAWEKQEYPLS